MANLPNNLNLLKSKPAHEEGFKKIKACLRYGSQVGVIQNSQIFSGIPGETLTLAVAIICCTIGTPGLEDQQRY
jgi:hypothetical protein